MKRCVQMIGSVAILFAVLMCIVSDSKAVSYSPNFNSDDMSKLPGYEYDKFDKKWKYSTSYELDATNLDVKLTFLHLCFLEAKKISIQLFEDFVKTFPYACT